MGEHLATELSASEIEELRTKWGLAKLNIYLGGYYAASGETPFGHVDMYITEERMPGCRSKPVEILHVRIRYNNRWSDALALDDDTASIAEAIRGYPAGQPNCPLPEWLKAIKWKQLKQILEAMERRERS